MLNPGLTDSTGQVGQQAWGIHLTRPPQCLDYIHALTHSVFYVGTGNSNPGPQWCITHSYECSDLYEVYLLVWIYFKTSHWDSSITLTIWHTFGLEDLTDLRNLEHLRFQKFVSSLLHEEGSKHVPCCRKHLWNIKALLRVWIASCVKKNTLHSFDIRQMPCVGLTLTWWIRTGRPRSSLKKHWCRYVREAGYGLIHTCGLKHEKWAHVHAWCLCKWCIRTGVCLPSLMYWE